MLSDQLLNLWNSKRFATSWILGGSNIEDIYSSIKIFAENIMSAGNISIENNPDFYLLKKEETKSITVQQVRKLQDFLATTPAISEYKIAIIYEADLMNNHASNCCLKMLEEPPKNTFLFLITTEPTNLSTTIKSRCHKLNIEFKNSHDLSSSYEDLLDLLLNSDINKKIKYLKEISTKPKEASWEEFCSNCLSLVIRVAQYNIGGSVSLVDKEKQYVSKMNISGKQAALRLEKVKNIIKDEKKFDLDKKHIGILLLECLS